MILQGLDQLHRAHDHVLAETDRAVQDAEEIAGRHALSQVRENPPFTPRSGNLQRKASYRVLRVHGRTLRIKDSAKYAEAIEFGARPHAIVARRAKFLRFMGRDGNWVFRRKVWHPGNKPYKFLWRASWSAYRVLGNELKREMDEIAKRF